MPKGPQGQQHPVEAELATLKDLYKGLSSGSMTLRRAGKDISKREIEILKREIKYVEDVLARLQPPKSTKLPRKLPDDPIARGVAIMREATSEKSKDRLSVPGSVKVAKRPR
jgi:hypothetical protein